MTYHEAVRLKAVTQQQESFFFIGMIRIVDQARILIEKNSLSFLKGDAMLGKVRSGLPAIPGKFDIAHSLILAISGAARNPLQECLTLRCAAFGPKNAVLTSGACRRILWLRTRFICCGSRSSNREEPIYKEEVHRTS